jgi:hypothetical protein
VEYGVTLQLFKVPDNFDLTTYLQAPHSLFFCQVIIPRLQEQSMQIDLLLAHHGVCTLKIGI